MDSSINPYYNLIPPKAESEDCHILSASEGSEDSGVPSEDDQNRQPQRPPRSIDEVKLELAEHSYINLGPVNNPVGPPLPKRQPFLVNPRSPAPVASSRFLTSQTKERPAVQRIKRRGACKCKGQQEGMHF
jgi:hypothetical protein